MKAILRITLALGVFAGTAHAFSLLGPYDTWMQPTNGFRQPGDIGGPMNLGEEYRWNVPVLTYSFDQSFLDYFGSNGVAAVEQAIQILNDLPPASQLDPTNYPPEGTGVNFSAQALNLTDLKSKTLAALLEQLGLAQPTRHVSDVYNFAFVNGIPIAQTVVRNFDPFSFAPTNWVNNTACGSYLVLFTNDQSVSFTAEEYPVNPLDDFQTAVADDAAGVGSFYTGLTRDDIGGLRYLLHTNNTNLEILLPGVHGISSNSGAYVNQAQRRGVDKITFVRRDYDGILGQFFTPYTNKFTDYYISNSAALSQQLERVITEPDIVFTAVSNGQDLLTRPQILRAVTSNWWNTAFPPSAAGPGLIRPPIRLDYTKPVELVYTADWLPDGNAGSERSFWGSFDSSTNAPVVYPPNGATADLNLHLRLLRDDALVGERTWRIPLNWPESVVVQTSTNLVNWVPHLVFGGGRTVEWRHYIARSPRFFRIVPNN